MKVGAYNNKEVAKLLRTVAAALEIKGASRFRIIAYERAASEIEQTNLEIKDLWENDKLTELPGIGLNIASYLNELFKTGKVKHFQVLLRDFSPAVFEFLDLRGIGAKTAWKLSENLKINEAKGAFKKLEQAARKGKIRTIDGFGEESEKNILEALEEMKRRESRILLDNARQIAQAIISYLKKEPAALRIDPLGSLRRMSPTVGDIDIAVATNEPKKVINYFKNYSQIKEIIASGSNTVRVILKSSQQVDLKTQKPAAYGAMLQHFTGSKQHNIHLREIAKKKSLSLSEYGIKVKKQGKWKLKEYKSEEDFYHALDMAWIPPELREDFGEIEAALKNNLPDLVKMGDIKGDLHIHSDFQIEPSHDLGQNSMKEFYQKAIDLGYQYFAFSEHNPSINRHNLDQTTSLLKAKKEAIDEIMYSFNNITQRPKIFNSLEVDIQPSGNLAINERAFDYLDFVIVSIHSSFRLSKKEMTTRCLKALSHPKAVILGHPTGRLLGKREGFELDWDLIFDFCLKHKKVLEINAFPNRLDLPDNLIREAVKKGVKMTINTDSHQISQMDNMDEGVSVARKGWAQKDDIINCWGYDKIQKWLINR